MKDRRRLSSSLAPPDPSLPAAGLRRDSFAGPLLLPGSVRKAGDASPPPWRRRHRVPRGRVTPRRVSSALSSSLGRWMKDRRRLSSSLAPPDPFSPSGRVTPHEFRRSSPPPWAGDCKTGGASPPPWHRRTLARQSIALSSSLGDREMNGGASPPPWRRRFFLFRASVTADPGSRPASMA